LYQNNLRGALALAFDVLRRNLAPPRAPLGNHLSDAVAKIELPFADILQARCPCEEVRA
jgi:hypothetical protein